LWKQTKSKCKVLWQVWIKAVTICYNFVIENSRDQTYWYADQSKKLRDKYFFQ